MHKTVWIDKLPFPYKIGFVPNAEAWDETLRDTGLSGSPYPTGAGMCSFFEDHEDIDDFCLVTINPKPYWNDHGDHFTYGVLVHEAVHCWQRICVCIGEHEPSIEFEAYMIQYIFGFLAEAFKETRDGNSSNKKAAKKV